MDPGYRSANLVDEEGSVAEKCLDYRQSGVVESGLDNIMLDTLILQPLFCTLKITHFLGELTNISAPTKSLFPTVDHKTAIVCWCMRRTHCVQRTQ